MRPSLTLSATASVAFTLVLLFLAPALPAQALTLLRDVCPSSPSAEGSNPDSFVDVGGRILFVAKTRQHGRELFVTDGTSAGTKILVDLEPGASGSSPIGLRAMGSFALFRANTTQHGTALWRTDGTAAGTVPLANFSGFPEEATEVHNGLYWFTASTTSTGIEPWISDGTAAGTRMLADLTPGPSSTSTLRVTTYAGGFVCAAVAQTGRTTAGVVYISDGTTQGTKLLQTIPDALVLELVPDGQRFFYWVEVSGPNRGLWVSDGSVAGTLRLNGAAVDQNPQYARFGAVHRGKLLFSGTHEVHGPSLFVSDGTLAGTRFLIDLDVTSSNRGDVSGWWDHGGMLWFSATTSSEGGEIWKTDGTALGTQIALRRAPGPDGFRAVYRGTVGSEFLFEGETDQIGRELYLSDGTLAGTRLLGDIAPGAPGPRSSEWVGLGGRYFFAADDGVTGHEPWISDGTFAGTRRIADLVSSAGMGDSRPGSFVSAGGVSWFSATDPEHGLELWQSDGTTQGTRLTSELVLGRASYGTMDEIQFASGRVFVSNADSLTGTELWVYEPVRGYQQVADLFPGGVGSEPSRLTPFGKRLFFFAQTSFSSGLLPFVTDGTPQGTLLLTSFPTRLTSKPRWPVVLGERIFFVGADGPYVSDGTPQGTTRLALPGATPGDLLLRFGDRLLIRSGYGATSLWISDGTLQGSRELQPAGSSILDVVVCSEARAYFQAKSSTNQVGLWVTDGSPTGTRFVKDLGAGVPSTTRSRWTAFGDRVLFTADLSLGLEPWISDGTAQGTYPLRDINPGSPSSRPELFTVVGEHAYFFADDGTLGHELWRTDGTPNGTVQILDLNETSAPEQLDILGQAGGRLALRYPDKQWGNEPFVLEDKATVWPVGEPCGPLTLGLRGLAAPRLGGSARYELFAAAPQQPLVLLFGAPSSWPLPWFSEACVAHFDPSTIFLVDTSVGSGARTLPIPAVQSLLGLRFVTQCFTVSGQPLRLSSSAGLLQLVGH